MRDAPVNKLLGSLEDNDIFESDERVIFESAPFLFPEDRQVASILTKNEPNENLMDDTFNPLMTAMHDQGDKINIDEVPEELTLSVRKVSI